MKSLRCPYFQANNLVSHSSTHTIPGSETKGSLSLTVVIVTTSELLCQSPKIQFPKSEWTEEG